MNLNNIFIDSIHCKNTHRSLKELDDSGNLEIIIPQIKDMKLVGECKYHVLNAYDHSLKTLEEFEVIINEKDFFPTHIRTHVKRYLDENIDENIDENMSKLELLKLGVFLHDIGKPDSKTTDDTGRVHFKRHEVIGADIVSNLAKKLGLSSKSVDLLYKYVRYHMALLIFYKTNNMGEKNLFEVFEMLGEDTIGILILGYCDIVATRKLLNPNEDMGVIKTYMEYALTNYIYRYK